MKNLANDCRELSLGIASYIAEYLDHHKSFKLRSFYGESFSLNLIERHNLLTNDLKKILIEEYKLKNKEDPEFHFEFNNYAFSDYVKRSKDSDVKDLYYPLRFKGTPCTNWTLLRSNVRVSEKVDNEVALLEIKEKIQTLQMDNGLILDDPGVKSFQYHVFSAAMLIEIYEETKDEGIYNAFMKAVEFIRKFILSNGEALYIGRGQEQSFGLGVLIYILSRYFIETKNEDVLEEIKRILKFISKSQYASGAFPLVFTGLEKETPANVDMTAENFCGWYPYNNFFDYLPFLGFYLHKAYEVLEQAGDLKEACISGRYRAIAYNDSCFIRVNKEKYTAILSLPGGYWTNDLPFPLVLYRERFITPMLGGEQFQDSLYGPDALSLPETRIGHFSWRRFGRGKFIGNYLIWLSPFGVLFREYKFMDNKIEIDNRSFCWFPSIQNFSFLKSFEKTSDKELKHSDAKVSFSTKIQSITKGYSAMGELKIIKTKMNTKIIMELT